MLEEITPLLLTYNEAPNIGRALDKLRWAKRIVIVDSGSTDATLDIVSSYPTAKPIHHPFKDFASQCNFGLSRVTTEWVLSLDADYVLNDDLIIELSQLSPQLETSGFEARFVYCVHGRPLRASLYPPRIVLYRKNRAEYRQEGHGHRVKIDGRVCPLRRFILHDDRKPLSRWLHSQTHYACLEADYLLASAPGTLRLSGRLRRMAWPAPILIFFYTLLVKGCILDGWPGWLYVIQRTLAEFMIALEIANRRLAD